MSSLTPLIAVTGHRHRCEVIVDSHLGAQCDIVANRQAARDPIWAAANNAADVTFWPIWTYCSISYLPMTVSRKLPRSMVVPAPISTSFWIRTGRFAALSDGRPSEEDEAIAVLTDAAAG